MRKKCTNCILCGKPPSKGRICERCRYQNRKDYYRKKYLLHYKKFGRSLQQPARFYKLKEKILQKGKQSVCEICGWNKAKEVLEVHHKDLNRSNEDISNLQILCPTCHRYNHFLSHTGNFRNLKHFI